MTRVGRPIEDAEAEQILNSVVDNGINFIDTANDYGRSEEYIGRFLSHRRDEFVLATKCGCTVVRRDKSTDDTPHVWTKENLLRGLNESLERMRTDYVDVVQQIPCPAAVFGRDGRARAFAAAHPVHTTLK